MDEIELAGYLVALIDEDGIGTRQSDFSKHRGKGMIRWQTGVDFG